jgi:hypothetical protein
LAGFGFVAQDEVCCGVAGPGLVELVAEGCERVGAPWRGEGVEADEQFTVAGDDVAGGEQGFADQGVCLVAWAGVVAVQAAARAVSALLRCLPGVRALPRDRRSPLSLLHPLRNEVGVGSRRDAQLGGGLYLRLVELAFAGAKQEASDFGQQVGVPGRDLVRLDQSVTFSAPVSSTSGHAAGRCRDPGDGHEGPAPRYPIMRR